MDTIYELLKILFFMGWGYSICELVHEDTLSQCSKSEDL